MNQQEHLAVDGRVLICILWSVGKKFSLAWSFTDLWFIGSNLLLFNCSWKGSKSTYSNDLNKNKAHTLKRPAWHVQKKTKGRWETLFLRLEGNWFLTLNLWLWCFHTNGPFPTWNVFNIARVLYYEIK